MTDFFEEGKKRFDVEDFKEALPYFQLILEEDEAHMEARYHHALTLTKLKHYKEAIDEFDHLISDFPDIPDYYNDRGVAYFNSGNMKEALTDFDHAVHLEPEHGYRYACRAFIRAQTGDLDGAIEDYKLALKIDPRDEISRNNLEFVQDKKNYKKVGAKPLRKSKSYFSKEEIEDYRQKFEIEHREAQVEEQASVPAGAILREMKNTLTSREKFSDFVKFVANGFRMPS